MEKKLIDNWQKWPIGRALPPAAKQMIEDSPAKKLLKMYSEAWYRNDGSDPKDWIIWGPSHAMKVGCRYGIFCHVSARRNLYPEQKNWSDKYVAEAYGKMTYCEEGVKALVTGIPYRGPDGVQT